MISICVPVYNVDISKLYSDLLKQADALRDMCEIILIDDASSEPFRKKNMETTRGGLYIQLQKNIGRAKIRNLFLKYATQPYLLFLDCDSEIINKNYLGNYIEAIRRSDAEVIVGSSIYQQKAPQLNRRLRWKYGHGKEMKAIMVRKQFPARSFMTNNFLIKKKVFEKINFDERITGYGHEDTLFGFNLAKGGVSIAHIHNPVLNAHLETNKEFLTKTKESIGNLIHLAEMVDYNPEFIKEINLLSFYKKIKPLSPFISFSFYLMRSRIEALLEKGYANLSLFDFYKLGLLTEAINKKKIKNLL